MVSKCRIKDRYQASHHEWEEWFPRELQGLVNAHKQCSGLDNMPPTVLAICILGPHQFVEMFR